MPGAGSTPLSSTATSAGVKARWFAGDPSGEAGNLRARAEGLGRVVAASQIAFGQGCVDGAVADLVQKHRWPFSPALQFWDEVVKGFARFRRYRALAELANRFGGAICGQAAKLRVPRRPAKRGPSGFCGWIDRLHRGQACVDLIRQRLGFEKRRTRFLEKRSDGGHAFVAPGAELRIRWAKAHDFQL